MFTGKVYINRNGHTVEKEFDNYNDYSNYLKTNNLHFPSFEEFPKLSLGWWSQFHNYLDNLIEKKIALPTRMDEHDHCDCCGDDCECGDCDCCTPSQKIKTPSFVDFSPYEKELAHLETSQAELKSQMKALKADQDKLETIRNKFVAHGKDESDEMMKRLDTDIKKVKEEIKSIEKKMKK